MNATEISTRINHLHWNVQRDMLNWLRETKGVPNEVIAEAAEMCGIHPKYAFRGVWDDELPFSYLWHMWWLSVRHGCEKSKAIRSDK